jgi:hypothetical protein
MLHMGRFDVSRPWSKNGTLGRADGPRERPVRYPSLKSRGSVLENGRGFASNVSEMDISA